MTEVEILAFCRQNLAQFKCPRAVEFGELPMFGVGLTLTVEDFKRVMTRPKVIA